MVVTPAEYVSERVTCIPEAAAAKRAGKLGGFLYNTSEKELEALLMKLFVGKVKNSQQINKLSPILNIYQNIYI